MKLLLALVEQFRENLPQFWGRARAGWGSGLLRTRSESGDRRSFHLWIRPLCQVARWISKAGDDLARPHTTAAIASISLQHRLLFEPSRSAHSGGRPSAPEARFLERASMRSGRQRS